MQLGIQGAPGDAQLLGRLAHIAPVGLQDIQQDLHFTGLQGPSPARVPAGKDRGRDIAGSGRGLATLLLGWRTGNASLESVS